MMRKRGRENPCFICGHFHNFEEGEVCGICGHKKVEPVEGQSTLSVGAHLSAFPTEVIPDFLYLGTYDNASRSELLKAQGISHILNVVATCPNLYQNSFTYFSMPDSPAVPFDDCFEFLEQARNGGARVLVHCMSGQSRSPAVVAAYLMRTQGMSLQESVGLLQQKRTTVNINSVMMDQLLQYELSLRGRQAGASPQQQQQQQQPNGVLQFDMSAVAPRAHGDLSSQGHLTFLGGVGGGSGTGSASCPPHQQGGGVPAFGFPSAMPAVPPQGFVFGSSHAPQQGSSQ